MSIHILPFIILIEEQQLSNEENQRYQGILGGTSLNSGEKVILASSVTTGKPLSEAVNTINEIRLANLDRYTNDQKIQESSKLTYIDRGNDRHQYRIIGITPDQDGFFQGVHNSNAKPKEIELQSAPQIDPETGVVTFADGVQTTLSDLNEVARSGNKTMQTLAQAASHVYGQPNQSRLPRFEPLIFTDKEEVFEVKPKDFPPAPTPR